MAKARQIAEALRIVAENLDREPEAELGTYFLMDVCNQDKQIFLNRARLMPRPVKKEYNDSILQIRHNFMASGDPYDFALRHYIEIPRSLVCLEVEPAKAAVYECLPLLSPEEESEPEAS